MKISKNILRSILFCGVRDEDIEKIIVPKVVVWEISGDFSKEKLKTFIEDEIRKLPPPNRHTIDKSPEQRRMDSLSRLLSLDNRYTSCVAVCFYKGELITSSNFPNPKESLTKYELTDCLARKMELIRNFLALLTKDIALGSQPNIREIQFSSRTKLFAEEIILKIIHPDHGGVGDVIPNNKKSRHKNREDHKSHLVNALLKLAQHCLLGIYTNGKKGFKLPELNALLHADNMTIIIPNPAVLQGQQLHAEQAMLHYLRDYAALNQEPSEEIINIGISKLCCQACHDVLNRQNDKISHRGLHGINFPRVYDIDKGSFYNGRDTMFISNLCPTDSESECDFFNDEAPDFEDEFPALEELTAAESEPRAVKTKANLGFYNPCSIEASASSACPDHKSLEVKI